MATAASSISSDNVRSAPRRAETRSKSVAISAFHEYLPIAVTRDCENDKVTTAVVKLVFNSFEL